MPENSPQDFQLPYLKHVLGFIGLHDVRAIVIEGTTLPQPAREKLVEELCVSARLIATEF
jgi:FMN-dependent NADH-azoreductase